MDTKTALECLKAYVRCASVSADPLYKQGLAAARDYVATLLQDAGLVVELVPTPLNAIVMAQRLGNPSWPHVLAYGHYDVQPVDPLALWLSDPFEPEVRSGRLYGRGTTDQKGPFITMLAGLMSALKAGKLALNLTVIVEGEEEIGSPSFEGFLKTHAQQLAEAHCVILSDTVSPSEDQIAIATGLRGLVALECLFQGPAQDVHSGFYGGAVVNPLHALMAVGASLHDAQGRVALEGFYEAVRAPQDWERQELARYPMTDTQLQQAAGVSSLAPCFEPFRSAQEALRFGPTLEFNGLGGGYQGPGSKTIIPAQAQAKITCRVVPDQDPASIQQAVAAALKARCPKGVHCSVTLGQSAPAYRVCPPHKTPGNTDTSVLAKAFAFADDAISNNFGRAPCFLPEGGSIPIIAAIQASTGLDAVMIGLALPQDNMHGPNESYSLAVMQRGIAMYRELFTRLGRV